MNECISVFDKTLNIMNLELCSWYTIPKILFPRINTKNQLHFSTRYTFNKTISKIKYLYQKINQLHLKWKFEYENYNLLRTVLYIVACKENILKQYISQTSKTNILTHQKILFPVNKPNNNSYIRKFNILSSQYFKKRSRIF